MVRPGALAIVAVWLVAGGGCGVEGNAFNPAQRCALDCEDDGRGFCHPDPMGAYCTSVRAEDVDGSADRGDGSTPDDAGQRDGEAATAECTQAEDCPAGRPLCIEGRCAPCSDDASCAPLGRGRCRADGACVECLAHGDCTAAEAGRCEGGACARCEADDGMQCSGVPGAPACDPAEGACVTCSEARGCSDPEPYCEASGAPACVECLLDSHCTDPAKGRCADSGRCEPCSADDGSQCSGVAGRSHCELGESRCEACVGGPTGDAQCGAGQTCTDTFACVPGGPGTAADCTTCFDDRQCAEAERACVALMADSGETLPEGVCLPLQDAVGAICTVRAYLKEVDLQDVRGAVRATCQPQFATCEEVLRFGQLCEGSEADPLCVTDGIDYLWTLECGVTNDCPSPHSCNMVEDLCEL